MIRFRFGQEGRRLSSVRTVIYLSVFLSPLAVASAYGQVSPVNEQTRVDPANAPTVVYRSHVTYRLHGKTYTRLEWVSPATGAWRAKEGTRTMVYRPGFYASVSSAQGTYVRAGSDKFLGYLRDGAVSLRPIGAQSGGLTRSVRRAPMRPGGTTTFNRGHARVTVRALGEDQLSAASARTLFTPGLENVSRTAIEVAPGTRPTLPVKAYWLGLSAFGRMARMSVEYRKVRTPRELAAGLTRRLEATAYMTFYELPTAMTTSAVPGSTPPAGEIQIVNQPRDLPLSQAALAAFDGINGDLRYDPWPREKVTLKSGESATVIPNFGEGAETAAEGEPTYRQFAVVTSETIVWVSSDGTGFKQSQMREIARALEPLAT